MKSKPRPPLHPCKGDLQQMWLSTMLPRESSHRAAPASRRKLAKLGDKKNGIEK